VIDVRLTIYEFVQSVEGAKLRILLSAKSDLNHATTYSRSPIKRLEEETIGVCAEVAFAKWKNRFWLPGLNTFHDKEDVDNVEVRGTSRPDGCLIIRDNDANDRPFVFVTGDGNLMRLVGWMYGKDAKHDEFMRNPNNHRPAWFVPQDRLRAMQ